MFSVENVGTDVRGSETLASLELAANPLDTPATTIATKIAIDTLVFIKIYCPQNFNLD
jgi:hypothetical protein